MCWNAVAVFEGGVIETDDVNPVQEILRDSKGNLIFHRDLRRIVKVQNQDVYIFE